MRNRAGAALVAAGLLVSGCAGRHRAVPSAGGIAQPSSAAPASPPPSTAAPASSPPSTTGPGTGSTTGPTAGPESPPASPGPVEITTVGTRLGRILVDGQGMTLYAFAKDRGDFQSTCTGPCAREWPPVVTNGRVTTGPGSNTAWASTIDRPDGTKQVEYNGWPLYRFARDAEPGDRKGQGVTAFGASWYVVDAATGRPVKKKE